MRLQPFLTALVLAATPLLAQDSPFAVTDYHFGAFTGISLPQGDAKDWVDGKAGLTLGGYVILNTQGGYILRPRLEYSVASNGNYKNYTYFLGADYLYFVSKEETNRLYVLGGLGFATTDIDQKVANDGYSGGAVALTVGAGYQFTPVLGAELRYQTTSKNFGKLGTYKNDAINMTVTYRF